MIINTAVLRALWMLLQWWEELDHVASRRKFLVAEGNQKSGEGARSGIGAWRRDFWIIRDNPCDGILVKKETYGVRQKECEGKQEGNFTATVETGTAEIKLSALQVCRKFSNPLTHSKANSDNLKEKNSFLRS